MKLKELSESEAAIDLRSKLQNVVDKGKSVTIQGTMIDPAGAQVILKILSYLDKDNKKEFMNLPISKMKQFAGKVVKKLSK